MTAADKSSPDFVVIDTSIAAKWILPELDRQTAIDLLTAWEHNRVRRMVPAWFAIELAAVLYKRARDQTITMAAAMAGIPHALATVIIAPSTPAMAIRAIEIAHQLNQGRPYDAAYLALAEALDCNLWTADERLYNAARGQFKQIRWLGSIR